MLCYLSKFQGLLLLLELSIKMGNIFNPVLSFGESLSDFKYILCFFKIYGDLACIIEVRAYFIGSIFIFVKIYG